MRTLPKNICAHPDGLLVRVVRGKVLYQAFVPKSHPTMLQRAVELRDKFLRIAGKIKYPKSRRPHRWARSNTGVVGVSETVQFNGVRAYHCFNVSWSVRGRQKMKRFIYRDRDSRQIVLANAIAHRRAVMEVHHV